MGRGAKGNSPSRTAIRSATSPICVIARLIGIFNEAMENRRNKAANESLKAKLKAQQAAANPHHPFNSRNVGGPLLPSRPTACVLR